MLGNNFCNPSNYNYYPSHAYQNRVEYKTSDNENATDQSDVTANHCFSEIRKRHPLLSSPSRLKPTGL